MRDTNIIGDFQVVVLMGGLGSRLKDANKNKPKAMADVNGKPFFEYQLNLMMGWGFKKFLFLVGHMGEQIEEYFGDGSKWGLDIKYSYDGDKLLGTAGAIRRAYDKLSDDFILIYGDSFMDINYGETVHRYLSGKAKGSKALMTVMRNNGQFDKSNVAVRDGKIFYDKFNVTDDMDAIDYGVSAFAKSVFASLEEDEVYDLAIIQNELSIKGEMVPQYVGHRFYEIGRPESLDEFRSYVKFRFEEKHPAVFLDRDGVIDEIVWNEDTEQLDSPLAVDQFEFIDGAIEGIKKLKEKGYYIFIATNQPACVKGKCTVETLYDINTYMFDRLKEEGVELDAIYICPHYHKEIENTKYPFLLYKCNCRKPASGLIEMGLKSHNIDMDNSYMVGDSITDIQAGAAAGIKTVYIGDLKCDACKKLGEVKPTIIAGSLNKAAELL